jgi:hypothetical protein
MRSAAGIYIEKHLYDHHLTDIMKVAEAAVKQHEKEGCRFEDDSLPGLKTALLAHLPDFIGAYVELKETFCPERGIGVKEAA